MLTPSVHAYSYEALHLATSQRQSNPTHVLCVQLPFLVSALLKVQMGQRSPREGAVPGVSGTCEKAVCLEAGVGD